MNNKKKILAATYVLAFIIGCIHFGIGLRAIFVFRNNEPITTWIAVIAGPLSTLPATFLSLFKRKIGGYWLIASGIVTLALLLTAAELSIADLSDSEVILRIGLIILLPIAFGSTFVYLSRDTKTEGNR